MYFIRIGNQGSFESPNFGSRCRGNGPFRRYGGQFDSIEHTVYNNVTNPNCNRLEANQLNVYKRNRIIKVNLLLKIISSASRAVTEKHSQKTEGRGYGTFPISLLMCHLPVAGSR